MKDLNILILIFCIIFAKIHFLNTSELVTSILNKKSVR